MTDDGPMFVTLATEATRAMTKGPIREKSGKG